MRTGRSYWDLFQPGHLCRELDSSQVITFCLGCCFSKQSSAARQASGMFCLLGGGVLPCLSAAARGLSLVAGAALC